jgi:hypothetical protein
MKRWEKIPPSVVVISLLLLLGCGSADAQGTSGYNGGVWTTQCKLAISEHQPDKTFSANEVDEAKMNIVIRDKKTNYPVIAQSDIEVWLSSTNGTAKPQNVTISKGNANSEAISLTSTQPGIASVIAEAAGFEAATTSVEFVTPPRPCELLLEAHPTKNIPANGKDSAKLTVKLLCPDGEPFIPQKKDVHIDIWTNKGETCALKISTNTPYGREEFRTYKWGTINITARSPDFGLEDSTEVTFISTITALTIFIALLGGFLGGVVKYYQEYKKGIIFWPQKQENDTWRLGMLGHSFLHAFFGIIVYMGACLNMPLTNLFELPPDIWYGVFMIGFTGGIFFFFIISGWGFIYKRYTALE